MWGEDQDLAAHVSVLREAGVALSGRPIQEVFPAVPWPDYADSLLHDLAWSREQRLGLYGVLNASRVWATLTERKLHSKLSGGLWALARAPTEFRRLIEQAVAVYRGDSEDDVFDADEVSRYIGYVEQQLAA
jgi:hypothetical protein